MPADSEPQPVTLPKVYRPFGVRMAVYVFGAMLFLTTAVIWFTFPQSVRDQFTLFQRGTVLVLGLGFFSLGWGMARSRVVARREGLTVVNGYRTYSYEWSEVLAVNLRRGSPWATLDLSDGTTASAIGIQGSDGARAVRQVKELRALVAAYSRTEHDR